MISMAHENACRDLIALRVIAGAKTALGHRYSNAVEQIKNLRCASGDQRRNLLKNLSRSAAEIRQLNTFHRPQGNAE